jgi:hypothetical protein
MTICEAREKLEECNYDPEEAKDILEQLAARISSTYEISGKVDIELTDTDPLTGEQPYDLSEPPLSREGWWITVSGSLPKGPNKDGREEWKEFEPSGSWHRENIEDVIDEFLDDLSQEGW